MAVVGLAQPWVRRKPQQGSEPPRPARCPLPRGLLVTNIWLLLPPRSQGLFCFSFCLGGEQARGAPRPGGGTQLGELAQSCPHHVASRNKSWGKLG